MAKNQAGSSSVPVSASSKGAGKTTPSWKNYSRKPITIAGGVIIQPGEVFQAEDTQIPLGFMDLIRPIVSELPVEKVPEKEPEPEPKVEQKKVEASEVNEEEYYVKRLKSDENKYYIYSKATKQRVNSEPYSKEEVSAFLKEKKAEASNSK